MQGPFTDPNDPNQSASKPPAVSVGDLFARPGETVLLPPQAPATPVYKSSGRIGLLSFPIFLVYAPLAAFGVGWLYWWIYQFGNMVAFSQMFFGAVLGAALWPAIKWGKCRNTKIAGLVAVLTAVLAYAVFLGFSARAERQEYVDGFTQYLVKTRKLPEKVARPLVENNLKPIRYFRMWMEDRAMSGVTFVDSDRTGNSSSGMRFQGKGFWALTAAEIGLVAICALLVACGAAGGRFNEEKNKWWNKKTYYNIHPAHIRPIVESARAGNWALVGKIGKESKTEGQIGAQVALYSCEADTLLSIFPPAKSNQPFWEGPIPPEGVAQLPRVLRAKK